MATFTGATYNGPLDDDAGNEYGISHCVCALPTLRRCRIGRVVIPFDKGAET